MLVRQAKIIKYNVLMPYFLQGLPTKLDRLKLKKQPKTLAPQIIEYNLSSKACAVYTITFLGEITKKE